MRTLRQLIDEVGIDEFARRTGASQRTVYAWRAGERSPPVRSKHHPTALDILEIYRGRITLAGVLGVDR